MFWDLFVSSAIPFWDSNSAPKPGCRASEAPVTYDICCRDHFCDVFPSHRKPKKNLNTPFHLHFSDPLNGPLILSLVHLISKFNRWMGCSSWHLTPICCILSSQIKKYLLVIISAV